MTAPANGVYSFVSVSASIVGPGISQIVTGAAREGYTIRMDDDKSTHTVGADGSGMHSMRASQAGTITFRLLKTSAMNKVFSDMYAYQTASPALFGRNTISVGDKNLGDQVTATGCGIVKFTDLSYGDEGGMNEWAFKSTYIDQVLGNGGVTNLAANG